MAHDNLRERVLEELRASEERVRTLLDETTSALEEPAFEAPELEAPEAGPPALSLRLALASIDGATTQEEVLSRLLEEVSRFCGRAALWIPSGSNGVSELQLWSGIGFQRTSFEGVAPLETPAAWNDVMDAKAPLLLDHEGASWVRASLGDGETDTLVEPSGGPPACAVLPFVLRDKTRAVLYADRAAPHHPFEINALQILCFVAAQTLELLPLRKLRPAAALAEPFFEQIEFAEPAHRADSFGDLTSARPTSPAVPDQSSSPAGDPAGEPRDLTSPFAPDEPAVDARAHALGTADLEELDEWAPHERHGPAQSWQEPAWQEATWQDVADEPAADDEPGPTFSTLAPAETEEAENDEDAVPAFRRVAKAPLPPPLLVIPPVPAPPEPPPPPRMADLPAAEQPAAAQPAPVAGSSFVLEEEHSEIVSQRPAATLYDQDTLSFAFDRPKTPSGPPPATAEPPARTATPAPQAPPQQAPPLGSTPRPTAPVQSPGDRPSPTLRSAAPSPSSPGSSPPVADRGATAAPPPSVLGALRAERATGPSVYDELRSAAPPSPTVTGPVPVQSPIAAPPTTIAPRQERPPQERPSTSSARTTQVAPPSDLQGPGSAFKRPAADGTDPKHEEAKRLARLLVSEIKLYNEEEIERGRKSGNIYRELRDHVDRSRRMYEERVDASVRETSDYFRQELVRNLARGDAAVLGC